MDEEKEGAPFVGRAGELLDQALAKAGLVRADALISNVARCRPPHPATGKNRKPNLHEIACCRGFLVEELAQYRPRVILAMGETAIYSILSGRPGGVLDIRGRVIWSEEFQAHVVCAYHPAYVLRKPAELEYLVRDLLLAKQIAAHGPPLGPPDVDLQVITTRADARAARDQILASPRFAFDWETEKADGPSALHLVEARGFCLAISIAPFQAFVFPRYGQDLRDVWGRYLPWLDREILAPIFASPEITKIGHHLAFDNAITRSTLGLWPVGPQRCTLIAHHTWKNHLAERAHGLKSLAAAYTSLGRYDDELDAWLNAHAYTADGRPDLGQIIHAPDPLVRRYNGLDAVATFLLDPLIAEGLQTDGLTQVYEQERMPLVLAYQEIDRIGIRIDVDYLDVISHDLGAALTDLESRIAAYAPPVTDKRGQPVPFNPGSTPQVGRLLYDDLHLPILARTETNAPSTREEHLLQFAEHHPAVALLLQWRAYAKLKGTYVDGVRDDPKGRKKALKAVLDPDGYARMSTRLHGTETFRLATRRPLAIHTWPKDQEGFPSVRSLVIPDDGYLFVSADFSQQELAIQAIESGQTDLADAIVVHGIDAHEQVMHDLLGISKAQFQDAAGQWLSHDAEATYKRHRSAIKACSFMVMYQGGARKLALMLGCRHPKCELEEGVKCPDLIQAEAFIAQFYARYEEIKWWQYHTVEYLKKHGEVREPFGARRVIPEIHDRDYFVQLEAARRAVNFPIQRGGSALMARAVLGVHQRFQREQFDGRVVFTVHDELLVQVPESPGRLADDGLAIVCEEMSRVQPELAPYALRVDGKLVPSWGGGVRHSAPVRHVLLDAAATVDDQAMALQGDALVAAAGA